ncbi:hypothetical protein MLD38_004576 [Melastoma candidum]|uniref:Uncharacterized protein n=1 Tax=Melastoma candidum TaxID=119954 RepID=A0ACB9S9E9_9MYRT|nr:hypothetical protein MLD38_004576 [Melastoma candidum]
MLLRICNGDVYLFVQDSYELPLAVVDEIVEKTPQQVGFQVPVRTTRTNILGFKYGPLYGVGYCTGSLSWDECVDCLISARSQLFQVCSNRGKGAQIHLKDRAIRYEEYEIDDL